MTTIENVTRSVRLRTAAILLLGVAALALLVFGLGNESSTSTTGSASDDAAAITVEVAGAVETSPDSDGSDTDIGRSAGVEGSAATPASEETDVADRADATVVGAVSVASLQASSISGDAEAVLPRAESGVVRIPDLVDGRIQPSIIAPNGEVSGWDIKDLRFRYDVETDTLIIGVNVFGLLGDADADGDPASWGPANTEAGDDPADVGLGEAVVLLLDIDQDGTADFLAGVPADDDWSSFRLAEALPGHQFGPQAAVFWGDPVDQIGARSPSPDAANPDLVFTITDFAELLDGDTSLDFGVNVFAGSIADAVGEDTLVTVAQTVPVVLEAELGDRVFDDVNSNGLQDDGEVGLAGVTVRLVDADRITRAVTLTDPSGLYSFTVAPGDWAIEVQAPRNSTFSPQDVGVDDSRDSDVNPDTGLTSTVTLEPGDARFDLDVGLIRFVAAPGVSLEKATNGVDADTAPGPDLEVGEDVEFSYVITNTGNVTLAGVELDDSVLGAVTCPVDRLAPNQSVTCRATGVVAPGNYRNVGTVRAQPVDDVGAAIGAPIEASDPSHHRGVVTFVAEPSIQIEKSTNGVDADVAPGPEILEGASVEWAFEITNTGNTDLMTLRVTDDVLGFVCQIGFLAVDESTVCAFRSIAVVGPHANVGSVSAVVLDESGLPTDEMVEDSDPSHYVGLPEGPVCDATLSGPRLNRYGTTRHVTGLDAEPGSTIRVVTSEPGDSPDQPHEQLYVVVGETRYGPTPVGLGELEFVVEAGGPVSFEHWSIHHPDDRRANSVEFAWCGSELSIPVVHTCPAVIAGPRLFRGGETVWDTGLVAMAGSELVVTTTEPGESPQQPHEQVYVVIGDERFGPTPEGLGTLRVTAPVTGKVRIEHWSVINTDDRRANSVEVELCGTELVTAASLAAGIDAGLR